MRAAVAVERWDGLTGIEHLANPFYVVAWPNRYGTTSYLLLGCDALSPFHCARFGSEESARQAAETCAQVPTGYHIELVRVERA